MSENPYAAYPTNQDDSGYEGPQRLSIPAVLSLITSLVCCIPGLGVLGVLLGLVGIMSISRSNGRLTGMPAAIAGMALGVLVTVAWVALAVGAASGANMWLVNVTAPMANFVEAAYDGDMDAARAELTTGAKGQVTDEEILRFAEALRIEFGDFQGPPADTMELIQGVWEGFLRSQNQQGGGGSQNAVPSTLYFDGGAIAIFGVIEPGTGGQPSQVFRFADFFVLLPNAEALTFRDDGPAETESIRAGFTPVRASEVIERNALGGSTGGQALPPGESGESGTDTDADNETPPE